MFEFIHIRRNRKLPQLFWQTDLHSHVCPGIDDGSHSPEKSVMLVKGMASLGFHRMIVTPHVTDEVFPNTPEIIAESYLKLTEACKKAGVNMEFSRSAEYRIDELLLEFLRTGQVKPLHGGYLLVENSWMSEPANLDNFIFELRNTFGLKPILAHPERYRYYQNHRERYDELRNQGVLFQVNLLSLAGHYDKACKNTAEYLVSQRMVDFLGSDVHRMAHIESIRNYLTSKDYSKLEAIASDILNDTLWP
ncbi:MAG: hypothetical protein HDS66_02790 [Bacteroidales bacterium]|nr:hypothetical protein [Bacteroidales bacterium]